MLCVNKQSGVSARLYRQQVCGTCLWAVCVCVIPVVVAVVKHVLAYMHATFLFPTACTGQFNGVIVCCSVLFVVAQSALHLAAGTVFACAHEHML